MTKTVPSSQKRPFRPFPWVAQIFLASSLLGTLGLFLPTEAAKKYYPPGFKLPPSLGETPIPVSPTEPLEEATPSHPQVIIRTIPVHTPAKPKDSVMQLLAERRFYEALRLTDQQLKKAPQNLPLRILRGQILREDENFQQSAAEYLTVLDKTKSKSLQAKAWSGLGMVQFYQGQHAESLGDHYGAQTLTNQAEASFQKALQLSSQLGEAWLGRAQVAMAQNQLGLAETFLQKGHLYGIPKVLELLTKSQLLLQQGKPNQALPLAFSAKSEAPNDPRVYLLLGQISIALDRADDAIIHLKQALERIPDHAEALRLLSVAYERKMKPEDAELVLQKAISLNPKDQESVHALLKIYDQRDDMASSVLLLKTLLTKPLGSEGGPEIAYETELIKRLGSANRWEEAFNEGSHVLLKYRDANAVLTEILNLFCKAAYLSGNGLLAPPSFLALPAVHQAETLVSQNLQANPADLQQRLNLMLLNPLATLPPSTENPAANRDTLPLALQISFLAGNQALHQTLLTQYRQDSAITDSSRLKTAEALYQIGDYLAGEVLLQQLAASNTVNAAGLSRQLTEARRKAEEQLKVLEVLPHNIPLHYWEEIAESALLTSRSNWKLHAILATTLYQRKDYKGALVHQRLAAQYATSAKERDRWLKKAAKTRSLLGEPSGKTSASTRS